MTKQELQALAELTLGENYPDTDAVNARFHSPFAGMKEMYALQKGIEAGCEAENTRLKPLITALIEDREALRAALKFYQEETFGKGVAQERNGMSDDGFRAHQALAASDARLAALKGEK